ncbi:MAG: RimK family alpha-L-glutamate ligase [Nitrospinae bacterium]|nr:RimK family alpha-L-glutamate ligase [Nitrospinota bacterium]
MRVGILCRDKTLHGVRRISEAARRRKHRVRVLDPYRFLLKLGAGEISLEFRGKPFAGADVYLPRLGANISEHSLALIRHLETSGALVVNGSRAIETARDKLRTLQLLAQNGLPVPKTAFAPDPAYLRAALEGVGGAPVVMKLPRGTQGKGVMRARDAQEAQAISEVMWSLQRDAIVQEYVEEARRGDLRVIVIGSEVAAAVRRRASSDDFRTNLHRGGSVKKTTPTKRAAGLAVSAAKLCGLEISGVDLLETKRGPLVLEVNAAPGFEGVERAGGPDVAPLIVDYVERRYREHKKKKG